MLQEKIGCEPLSLHGADRILARLGSAGVSEGGRLLQLYQHHTEGGREKEMDGEQGESERSLEERNREEGEWERKGGIGERKRRETKRKGRNKEREIVCCSSLFTDSLQPIGQLHFMFCRCFVQRPVKTPPSNSAAATSEGCS